MLLVQLFLSFVKIGLLSFGGGYAALPLIQEEIVNNHHWLTSTEYTDVLTISQMTPGPIAINAASFVGTKLAGVPGSIIATLGCVAPSVIIVSFLAWFYFRYRKQGLIQGILGGLRPAVVALIASSGYSIILLALWGQNGWVLQTGLDLLALLILVVAFMLLRAKLIKPISAIVLSGLAGVAAHLLQG
ncbi:MAG TPA: chromate transporter [Clostridiaceae bacterium]|nr:chromate transporter [Clostridiaceae bacterium]